MATPSPAADPPVDPPADPIAVPAPDPIAVQPADAVTDLPAEPVADPIADPIAEPIADPIPDPELPVPGLETPPVAAVPMPPSPTPAAPTEPAAESAAESAAAARPPRTVRALPMISAVGPISGIFFVALFLISFMTMNTPETDASNREWTSYWEDSGNRAAGMTASIAMMLAAIAFLWLVAALRRRLTPAIGTDAFYAAGIAAGALMFVSGLGAGLIPFGNELGDVPIPDDADVIRLIDGLYFGTLFLPLPYALAGFLIPLFFALRGAFLVPRWLEWATLVVGVVALTGPLTFVVPHALFMLWTLAVSVTLLLRERDLPVVAPTL